MPTARDEGPGDMWHTKSRAYSGAKIKSYTRISLRHQRSCADLCPIMNDHFDDCNPMWGETAYHRQTYMGATEESSDTVISSEPSWVAAQGKHCACLVTWNKGNSKKREDFEHIFDDLFEEPEAAVSLQLGINEITVANGRLGINEINVGIGRTASFLERNYIVVTSFLRQLLLKKKDLSYDDTIKLAVFLFDQVFPGFVEADKIKIFVLKWGKEEDVMTVEDETLLKDSRKLYGKMRRSKLYGKLGRLKRSRPLSRKMRRQKLYGKKPRNYDSQKRYGKMRHSMKLSGQ